LPPKIWHFDPPAGGSSALKSRRTMSPKRTCALRNCNASKLRCRVVLVCPVTTPRRAKPRPKSRGFCHSLSTCHFVEVRRWRSARPLRHGATAERAFKEASCVTGILFLDANEPHSWGTTPHAHWTSGRSDSIGLIDLWHQSNQRPIW
jgi:hypothetical protein